MASTNTNTNPLVLSTDIYDVSAFLDQIRINTIPNIDETSAMIGIFGYMNEMFSQSLQNTLIVTAETSNEAIPTRAKFTKNVINHAMNLNITDIYARPACITLMVYLPVDYIDKNLTVINKDTNKEKSVFILDKNCPITIGGFEYHFDYDIIITRIRRFENNTYKDVYTAMYDLFESGTTIIRQENPISDINNPYITTVVQTTINRVKYMGFSARLHQVTLSTIDQTILTNNPIENKSITFTFNDQLAAFDIDVIENDKTVHLFPIYEGLLNETIEDGEWCYYEFIDEHTIRILFSRDSYVPGLNATVRVNIKQTEGSAGNFTYTNVIKTSLRSERYSDYNGMYILAYPLLNGISNGGKDRKTIFDLKRIIPREASSRGAVINTADLQNFFNSIDDDTCRIYFKKKRDNQFERMYYSYILMRKGGCVYPTNTLSIKLKQDNFKGFAGNNNLSISPGTVFYYYNHGTSVENAYATLVPPIYEEGLDPDEYPYPMTINEDGDLVRVFEYISPFLITIDDDLISSYLMTVLNENKTFKFLSINTDSDVQFVSTNINLYRSFIYDNDDGERCTYDYKYVLTMDIIHNTTPVLPLVKVIHLDDGTIQYDDIRVKVIMVLYSDETGTTPYKYVTGQLTFFDDNTYSFKFELGTDDLMDLKNRINITGVYNAKPEAFQPNDTLATSNGYMNKDTFAKLFILADFGTKAGDIIDRITITPETEEIITYGVNGNRTELESIVPTREDLVDAFLNNEIYIIKNGISLNAENIIRRNNEFMDEVKRYNGNESESTVSILRYLRNNKNSSFVRDKLLKNTEVNEVIDSYNYENFERYTVCNTMAIDGGITFYHDYSAMMRSDITVSKIPLVDDNGLPVMKTVARRDAYNNTYTEYVPQYLINNDTNSYVYEYTVGRIPMIMNGFLNTEEMVQDYIYNLEERRKYITECLYVLEDTFDIDLKFFNTYGPSQMFYYNIPSSQNYHVRVSVKELNMYRNQVIDENDESNIIDTIKFGTRLHVTKIKGQWAYVTDNSTNNSGWIKLADTTKIIDYIDNVALSFKWALQAESSADKYVSSNIINDIKEYIENINEINELHIPNIITLITNNYREQLVYFEFLDVNGYGSACQHLYLDEKIHADICPEFLNIATLVDSDGIPDIDIAVY